MSANFIDFAAFLTRETGYSENQSRFLVSALQYDATMYERFNHCKITYVAIMDKLFEKRLVNF